MIVVDAHLSYGINELKYWFDKLKFSQNLLYEIDSPMIRAKIRKIKDVFQFWYYKSKIKMYHCKLTRF